MYRFNAKPDLDEIMDQGPYADRWTVRQQRNCPVTNLDFSIKFIDLRFNSTLKKPSDKVHVQINP